MKEKINRGSDIVIYRNSDGLIKIDVRVENETVWLSLDEMSELFQRNKSTISRHIKNIFDEGELDKKVVVANYATTTQHGAIKGKNQSHYVNYYNLDVIISVGYRVKSLRGTQFRIWANRVLKDYIVKGYAINDRITRQRYDDLKAAVKLLSHTIEVQERLSTDESKNLFAVISDYVYALDTLDRYDFQTLAINQTTADEPFRATYDNAMDEIRRLHAKFGGSRWFGNEKDDSFKSSIGQIYQTFGGEELYPSVEEKAAMLLYLVTKNHSFSADAA